MISFKAQYVKPVIIQKLGIDSKYHDYKASLVELSPESHNDFLSLNEVNKNWNNSESLAYEITRIFNGLYRKNKPSQNENFFAITTQKKDFDKLNENLILGLVQTRKPKNLLEIENLQVNPNTNYDAKKRAFKHIGSALINFIKKELNPEEIYLNSKRESIPFYQRHRFKLLDAKGSMIFRK